MQDNLSKALDFITTDEGEELNVSPDEPGGASKWGVTLTDLSEVRGKVCTVADVSIRQIISTLCVRRIENVRVREAGGEEAVTVLKNEALHVSG
jgi:hypothetical protein